MQVRNIQASAAIFALSLVTLLSAAVGQAAVLDASQNLNTLPPLGLASGTQNVALSTAGTWTGYYDFGDKNGDGTRDDAVSPAGLDLGTYNLYSSQDNSQSILLNLNGGNLTGSGGYISTSNRRSTGHIHIFNVGEVGLGNGYLYTGWTGGGYSGNWNPNGSILIGQDGTAGPRAGSVQAASISTYTVYSRHAGDITIHSTGNVLIKDASDTPGTLSTSVAHTYGNSGDMQILHDGTFLAGQITANVVSGRDDPGDLLFNGDVLANGASGTFTADLIDTHDTNLNWGAYAGHVGTVTIQGYTGVTLGSVDTRMKAGGGAAGFLSVTGITGNIAVTGTIDLDGYTAAGTADGDLTMSVGGKIELASLDLDLVRTATFGSVLGTYITGTLANFNTADPTNSGLVEQYGGNIYYDPDDTGNAYLLAGGFDGAYQLSSGALLPGVPAAVPEPATFALLSLGGLGLLAARRRRAC